MFFSWEEELSIELVDELGKVEVKESEEDRWVWKVDTSM